MKCISPLAALLFAIAAGNTYGQVNYVSRLGFTDTQHTNPVTGFQRSTTSGSLGQYIRGTAERFNASGATTGETTFISTGSGQTIQVGLTGGVYGGTGTVVGTSAIYYLNSTGVSAGTSAYVPGGIFNGEAAWLATSSGSTTQVGLFSAAFTRSDGWRNSTPSGLTAGGYVYGTSDIFTSSGTSPVGVASWVASASTPTARVGLSGLQYQSSAGAQNSVINAINSLGVSVGISTTYSGSATFGQSAWRALLNGTTVAIGQTDANHTSVQGAQYSSADFISDGGFIAGYSYQYSGAAHGQTAWRISPSGTLTQIGFYSTNYSDNGLYTSKVTALNDIGAAGYSVMNGNSGFASTAWYITSSGSVQTLGLTGSGYLNSFGVSSNRPEQLTVSGYVAGTASRYSPTYQGTAIFVQQISTGTAYRVGLYGAAQTAGGLTDNKLVFLKETGRTAGYSLSTNYAWAADAAGSSYQIGEYSADFTDGSGGHQQNIQGMSDDGWVWGTTQRTVGGGYEGWLSLDSTTQINLSYFDVLSPGQYGTSSFLGASNGVAWGFFYQYDASGVTDGRRAFIYTIDNGFTPIAAADGWLAFEDAYVSGDMITGNGVLLDGSQGVYLANIVPEPVIPALLLLSGVILIFFRRRFPAACVCALVLPFAACSKAESVDSITGFCDIKLNSPLAELATSKWAQCKIQFDGKMTLAQRIPTLLDAAAHQIPEAAAGDVTFTTNGAEFLHHPTGYIIVGWRMATDFRTPIIESVTVYFADQKTGDAAYQMFIKKFGPPNAPNGRWQGENIHDLYATGDYVSVTSRAREQMEAATRKRDAMNAARTARSMPTDLN
ncbi:hypothetical protein BH09VER1_BH09VER1_16120 [soil metagenome]